MSQPSGGAIDAAEGALGPIGILIKNAGIAPYGRVAKETAAMVDQYDEMLNVNLRGPYF